MGSGFSSLAFGLRKPCQVGLAHAMILCMIRATYAFFYFFTFPTPLVEEGKRRTH